MVATDTKPTIIGSGLAGLSAALTLARAGVACRLVSAMESARSQSVMAEGGINGALDTMGEGDSPELHFADTMSSGGDLADPNAVRGLTQAAPGILRELHELGMPFNLQENGQIVQRYFGGQCCRRSAFAVSATGKMLVETLVDAVRQQEAAGLVDRLPNHEFVCLLMEESKCPAVAAGGCPPSGHAEEGSASQPADTHHVRSGSTPLRPPNHTCQGVRIRNSYTGEVLDLHGPAILASGGMNGMVPGRTTGTTQNTGDVTAIAFAQGVACGNLEMIQYHPTTVAIPGKCCLVTEAARGEGGRLYVERTAADGTTERYYFMEDRFPERGNLMPRDVVSREEWRVVREEGMDSQVYLDLTGLSDEAWASRLADLREEVQRYLGIDAAAEPIPVEPGIHYFMGGIWVDEQHRTSVPGLYAAGECCCQYHGANRLGGNSTLGAIYGGRVAAQTLVGLAEDARLSQKDAQKDSHVASGGTATEPDATRGGYWASISRISQVSPYKTAGHKEPLLEDSEKRCPIGASSCIPIIDASYKGGLLRNLAFDRELGEVLYGGLGIVRDEQSMKEALEAIRALAERSDNPRDQARIALGEAWLLSALARKESRGAHFRSDYPERDETLRAQTVCWLTPDGTIELAYAPVPAKREEVADA